MKNMKISALAGKGVTMDDVPELVFTALGWAAKAIALYLATLFVCWFGVLALAAGAVVAAATGHWWMCGICGCLAGFLAVLLLK